MALLKFDSKTLKMDLVVGVDEDFKPKPEIRELNDRIQIFKEETKDYVEKNWDGKSLKRIVWMKNSLKF